MKRLSTTAKRATILRWRWYRDAANEFRVRANHMNGEPAFASTEGYKRRAAALKNAGLFGAPVAALKGARAMQPIEALAVSSS